MEENKIYQQAERIIEMGKRLKEQSDQITALQSSLAEKEKECEEWSKIFSIAKEQIEELKAENEHIKNVLKRFMSTIPIDNGNWYLPNFNEAKDEANELLNKQ